MNCGDAARLSKVAGVTSMLLFACQGQDVSREWEIVANDRDLGLSGELPEQRLGYRVLSTHGWFEIHAAAYLQSPVTPMVRIAALDDTLDRTVSLKIQIRHADAYSMDLYTTVQVNCANQLPCVADLQYSVSAADVPPETAVGKFSAGLIDSVHQGDKEYILSIQPLTTPPVAPSP